MTERDLHELELFEAAEAEDLADRVALGQLIAAVGRVELAKRLHAKALAEFERLVDEAVAAHHRVVRAESILVDAVEARVRVDAAAAKRALETIDVEVALAKRSSKEAA